MSGPFTRKYHKRGIVRGEHAFYLYCMLPSYGVLIGRFDHAGEHQGQWLHALLYLNVSTMASGKPQTQQYECAVDVNEPTGNFQYQIFDKLDVSLFQTISSMAEGYHPLARDSSSGAIDYSRSPILQRPLGCLAILDFFMNAIFRSNQQVWKDVTGDEAGQALIALVQGSAKVYVFGAPYTTGLGMHDVHCNQGDPVNSQFHSLDGIWQDGCVFILKPDGTLSAYLGKFADQSLNTDNNGYPK